MNDYVAFVVWGVGKPFAKGEIAERANALPRSRCAKKNRPVEANGADWCFIMHVEHENDMDYYDQDPSVRGYAPLCFGFLAR